METITSKEFAEGCAQLVLNTSLLGKDNPINEMLGNIDLSAYPLILSLHVRISEIPFNVYVEGEERLLKDFLEKSILKLKGAAADSETERMEILDEHLDTIAMLYLEEIRAAAQENFKLAASRALETISKLQDFQNSQEREFAEFALEKSFMQGFLTMKDFVQRIDSQFQIAVID